MKLLILLPGIILLPIPASAGHLFGAMYDGGRPVQSAAVAVSCFRASANAQTGSDGGYRLYVQESGKCTLRVTYRNQTAETSIISFDTPTRYDFDLVAEGNRYVLRKR